MAQDNKNANFLMKRGRFRVCWTYYITDMSASCHICGIVTWPYWHLDILLESQFSWCLTVRWFLRSVLNIWKNRYGCKSSRRTGKKPWKIKSTHFVSSSWHQTTITFQVWTKYIHTTHILSKESPGTSQGKIILENPGASWHLAN